MCIRESIDIIGYPPTRGQQTFIDNNRTLFECAKAHNFKDLCSMYIDKDQLLDDKKQDQEEEKKKGSKRDNLIKHLFKIQNNIALYQNNKLNEFLRATDYLKNIVSIEKKRILRQNIEELTIVGDKSIEEVIYDANEKGICIIDDNLSRFMIEKKYVYDRVKDVKFSEFQELYKYLEGFTPFSTQHKTKGTEFDNVLVILDNGGWNNYNFEKMFNGTASESVMNRSKKIFYVCCTRSKENLAVYFHTPSSIVISKAEELFGVDNVINLDEVS
jgi:DNA helicase-2/ATP-dependent DNA helicase PcrA